MLSVLLLPLKELPAALLCRALLSVTLSSVAAALDGGRAVCSSALICGRAVVPPIGWLTLLPVPIPGYLLVRSWYLTGLCGGALALFGLSALPVADGCVVAESSKTIDIAWRIRSASPAVGKEKE
eukprot:5701675-Pleurochrysis_carterae.AAC.1